MKPRPYETDAPRADPDIDENGVDRSQIRAMLQLTPEERLLRVEETPSTVTIPENCARTSLTSWVRVTSS